MALFSGYFDPSSYSGGSAGLFDRLLQQVEAGNLLQAQTPDRTVAVGDYQMPQFGSAPAPISTDISAQSRQPMPAPVPTTPEPAFGDRLMAGLEGFANAGGVIPAIAGGINGLVTGERSNPRYLKQQQMEGAYNAMIAAGVPGQAARGAVASGNTELMKFVLEKYSKPKFGFATLPDGSVVRQDQSTGDVSEAYRGATKPKFGVVRKDDGTEVYGFIDEGGRKVQEYGAPSGPKQETVTGPDGKEVPIPPGVDRKTFVKKMTEINADVAGGKMTEVQAKSAKFGNQMELAERNLAKLTKDGTAIVDEGAGLSGASRAANEWLGTNFMMTGDQQTYTQAKNSFITALLRDESGAAIGSAEFKRREAELFPSPGDGADVIAQKAQLRKNMINGMIQSAGPGYKPIVPDTSSSVGTKTSTGISWSIEK